MSIGYNAVVFLIGAGCSYDAGIPMSSTMISKIEAKLDNEWSDFRDLYYYVKYTIEYGIKLGGVLQDYNIESLLVTLHHLAEHKKSILYPFISGYSNDLIDTAGRNFKKIGELIDIIEKELPKWITKSDYKSAEYYSGFDRFQQESNYPIRIFSLNYDLCVEKHISTERLETGFADGEAWDDSRFTHPNEEEQDSPIYLYKLHGSIDWERINNELIRSQQLGIKPEIVFGTDVKMQAVDPYLFYLYEFRKYASLAKILIVIGYSFNDGHINDLIKQALEADDSRKMLVVNPSCGSAQDIISRIGSSVNPSRVEVENDGAREFLTSKLTIEHLASLLTEPETPF